MIESVRKYIIDNELIDFGESVLVALSGGPDSVCLLHVLYKLKKELNINLGAIHINHLLRRDSAYKDEEYVVDLCKSLNVECYVKRININDIAKEKSISLEMAGREQRYKAFEDIKKEFGYDKVAVAHNANDQAETLMMRIMRGTGLEGLTGIRCKRDGGIVRPILFLSRDKIEEYCNENKLVPRIDTSNFEKNYNRNKVRLDILPYMKENFNKDIVETLNRMALLLQSDDEYLQEQSINAYRKYCVNDENTIKISKKIFSQEKESIFTRVIKIVFKEVSNSHQNFEMKHIYEVVNLNKKPAGKKINLTNGVIVENSYNDITFGRDHKVNNFQKIEEIDLLKSDIPKNIDYDVYEVSFQLLDVKNNIEFSNNDLIKYFDYDKIEEEISIRHRKDGDKIRPLGMVGSKKIKDIFINLKVPREERDRIPILVFDSKVAWVVGYKVSEEFKTTKDTKKLLKVIFQRKD